jgi:hypothetical protein
VQGQQQAVPGATGSFTLTASTYTLDLTVPGQGTLHDTGTYSVSGSQWSQSSTSTGQATGTYALSGNQLNPSCLFLDDRDLDTHRALPYRVRHTVTGTAELLRGLAAIGLRWRSRVEEVLAY